MSTLAISAFAGVLGSITAVLVTHYFSERKDRLLLLRTRIEDIYINADKVHDALSLIHKRHILLFENKTTIDQLNDAIINSIMPEDMPDTSRSKLHILTHFTHLVPSMKQIESAKREYNQIVTDYKNQHGTRMRDRFDRLDSLNQAYIVLTKRLNAHADNILKEAKIVTSQKHWKPWSVSRGK